jgi:hypothetical protein
LAIWKLCLSLEENAEMVQNEFGKTVLVSLDSEGNKVVDVVVNAFAAAPELRHTDSTYFG